MDAELNWGSDKQRFVERFGGRGVAEQQVAGTRTQVRSPLVQSVADMARDLFGTTTLADILDRIVEVTVMVVRGATLASITVRDAHGRLRTPSYTDTVSVTLDELQQECGEGPFTDATDSAGTGISGCHDLAREPSWSVFGPVAAEQGVRSVLSAGLFPPHEPEFPATPEARTRLEGIGALNVYSTEPRGLAAADPDIVMLLASYAVTAVTATDAVTERDPARVGVGEPLRSDDVVDRAAEVLLEKRRLGPDDAYDTLRRASEALVEAWNG